MTWSDTPCIPWEGYRDRDGYGRSNGNAAHRIAYETSVGPVPDGMQLDHLCRNRACVNTKHLEPVTPRDNTLRSPIARAAVNARKTHCIHGHEFTPENTGPNNHGGRACRACGRAAQARYRARQKEKTS